jgi:hypothetical protein
VSSGLRHLSGLSRLRKLSLVECSSISNGHIQSLSALSALTSLYANKLQISGASLSALASLRSLTLLCCRNVAAAGLASIAQLQQLQQLNLGNGDSKARRATELAPLSQLTSLEELRVPNGLIEGPALALLDLPRLTRLKAWRISAEQHEAGRGAAIRILELRSIRGTALSSLLPLPSVERLTIHQAYGDMSAVGKQSQLTHLGLGGLERSSGGSGLAIWLPELQRLQALHLGRVWGCLELEDVLALPQLQQLEELCIENSNISSDLYCLLQRCATLRKVVLLKCGSVGLPAMMALVSKVGMQEVELRKVEGSDAHKDCLQRAARQLGVQLIVTSCYTHSQFLDRFYD